MKNILLTFALAFSISLLNSQDIAYSFDNVVDNGTTLTMDVMVSTTTPFKLGSGQFYLDYSTAAFGASALANGNFSIATASPYILGLTAGFPVYNAPVLADNTPSRISIAWVQGTSSGCFSNNVTVVPSALLQVTFTYSDNTENDGVCFNSTAGFTGLTFTACGPDGSCAFADCVANPATQITSDTYDCTKALPIELLDFDVVKKGDDSALVTWTTAREENTSHFVVERSIEGSVWEEAGFVAASGRSDFNVDYSFEDSDLKLISNDRRVFYYRLKSVDLDNSFDYSDVKNIELNYGDITMHVYPNPSSDGVNIRITHPRANREELTFTLVDITGKVVQAGMIGDAKEINHYLDFASDLVPGTYMLNINTPSQTIRTERLIIISEK